MNPFEIGNGISFTATHLNQAGALLHIYKDGSAHLNHGGTEMGQGLFIKVAQVVAAEFGIDIGRIKITASAKIAASTGIEMEALTAVSLAALTIYDMCKAVDRGMTISQVQLKEKHGGKSGSFVSSEQ